MSGNGLPSQLRVIDSHTIGEPTRVVIDESFGAGLDLGTGTVRERRDRFRKRYDHVMLLGPPAQAGHDGRAFVLCPDGAFDRSPCGTGTSALVGCLFEDGMLEEGRTWRQESVLGGVYEASVRREGSMLVPMVRGRAWIAAETTLRFAADDPYRTGLGSF